MDIKIENKDIKINDSGKPVMIDGLEQVIQQINCAITVKKGSFIYDREMGVDISGEIFDKKNAINTVQTLIYECLINVPEVTVKVEYLENRNDKIYAGITVSDGYHVKNTEVIIYE